MNLRLNVYVCIIVYMNNTSSLLKSRKETLLRHIFFLGPTTCPIDVNQCMTGAVLMFSWK